MVLFFVQNRSISSLKVMSQWYTRRAEGGGHVSTPRAHRLGSKQFVVCVHTCDGGVNVIESCTAEWDPVRTIGFRERDINAYAALTRTRICWSSSESEDMVVKGGLRCARISRVRTAVRMAISIQLLWIL